MRETVAEMMNRLAEQPILASKEAVYVGHDAVLVNEAIKEFFGGLPSDLSRPNTRSLGE